MIYKDKTYQKERELYSISDSEVINCKFEGKEDGESPLKECKNIKVNGCVFKLRYPFWHNDNTFIKNSSFEQTSRAPFWYCNNLSFDNVVSGITHAISGFASLYIGISKMTSMKVENIIITFAILLSFCVVAYGVNHLINYNYMFLMRGDGTPYDIFYNMVNGSKILYPLVVVFLFILYVSAFYLVFYLIKRKKNKI